MSSEVDNGVKLFASLLRAIRNVYEFGKGVYSYDFVRGAIVARTLRCLRNVLRLFGLKVGAYLVQIVIGTVQRPREWKTIY